MVQEDWNHGIKKKHLWNFMKSRFNSKTNISSSDKDRANEPDITVLVSRLYVGKPGYKTFGCDEVLFFINTSLI